MEKKEEIEKEAEVKPVPEQKTASNLRRIVIETDGSNFRVVKAECTNLELKEICRQIILKLGG